MRISSMKPLNGNGLTTEALAPMNRGETEENNVRGVLNELTIVPLRYNRYFEPLKSTQIACHVFATSVPPVRSVKAFQPVVLTSQPRVALFGNKCQPKLPLSPHSVTIIPTLEMFAGRMKASIVKEPLPSCQSALLGNETLSDPFTIKDDTPNSNCAVLICAGLPIIAVPCLAGLTSSMPGEPVEPFAPSKGVSNTTLEKNGSLAD